jgi:hypothetical protein
LIIDQRRTTVDVGKDRVFSNRHWATLRYECIDRGSGWTTTERAFAGE